MKKIRMLCIAFLLLLFAALTLSCKQNPIEEYGDALIDSYKRGQRVGKEADLKNIRTAIQIYRATNGEYPKSLKDVEEFAGFSIDTELYQYSPETGKINLKN